MGFYDEVDINQNKLTRHTEKLFMLRYRNTLDGKDVIVDDSVESIPMIVEKHTNPLNENKHDLKVTFLNSHGENLHLGNKLTFDDKDYLAVTRPSTNGIYSQYRVLPLVDDITFEVDTPIETKCVLAIKGEYEESSFINDTNVFEDKNLRAILIQFNEETNKLTLFDDVYVNAKHYRLVKIDDATYKRYDENFGVIQLVAVAVEDDTIMIDGEKVKGVMMSARVKDKILNSLSKEIVSNHDVVKRGDYINYTLGDKEETYLVINRPTRMDGYDLSLSYLCERSFNLRNEDGDIVKIPFYYENNALRIDRVTDTNHYKLPDSAYQLVVQTNPLTRTLMKDKRIIIDDNVYVVNGVDPLQDRLTVVSIDLAQKLPTDNFETGIANDTFDNLSHVEQNSTYKIVEKYDTGNLYINEVNEYSLVAEDGTVISNVTWTVDKAWINFTQDGTKCTLEFNDVEYTNEKFVLIANDGTNEYTLELYTRYE